MLEINTKLIIKLKNIIIIYQDKFYIFLKENEFKLLKFNYNTKVNNHYLQIHFHDIKEYKFNNYIIIIRTYILREYKLI